MVIELARFLVLAVVVGSVSPFVWAQPLDSDVARQGAEIYEARCAACHDHLQDRIPPRSALHMRSPKYVLRVLTSGTMRQNAAGLTGGSN